jgi:hypothetical protein
MSLALDRPGTDSGVEVKTFGISMPEIVFVRTPSGSVEIRQEDFLDAAFYVLINTDLRPGDYRLRFIEAVKGLVEAPGYHDSDNPNTKRLAPARELIDSVSASGARVL